MRPIVKVLLPYSFFAGLGLAIWFSFARPVARVEVGDSGRTVEAGSGERAGAEGDPDARPLEARCAGCGGAVDGPGVVRRTSGGREQRFCCGHCALRGGEGAGVGEGTGEVGGAARGVAGPEPREGRLPQDPVCHMEVAPAWGFEAHFQGRPYYFCTADCRDRFARAPQEFLGDRCAVCRELNHPAAVVTATYLGQTWRLCGEEHRRLFQADPAEYFMHTMWGIPGWMYYLSIAIVLVVSFGLCERSVGIPSPETPGRSGAARAGGGRGARVNLLAFAPLRRLAAARPVRFLCQVVVAALFLLVIAAGLFGHQNPALNIAPILTWTVWWGGLVILILFAGKAWCWVCPWDAVAGWMEKLRLWRKTDAGLGLNLPWPKSLRNVVVATVLFVALTWVELGFGVTMRPRVTAYLALAMLGMAIVSAFLFERKGFCRYACLVGRVSGLYAMFSGTEVRAKDQNVCRGCAGKECVRGTSSAYGCPTFLFPGYLASNTYCIQCLECVQACPSDNLAVNLRPWGADLIGQHRPRTDEAYLALLMLSITGFHGLTMTARWTELTSWLSGSLSLGRLLAFSLGMTLLMLLPILVYGMLVWLSYRLGRSAVASGALTGHEYFVRYAYALLPIALFYHLAHNMEHLLMEGPKVVALASDPFGWNWNLLGTAHWSIPPLVSLDVLWLVQVALVLVGHVYSLWIAHHTSRALFAERGAAFRSQVPMLAAMIAFSVFSLWLLKQPMEMRTSAM